VVERCLDVSIRSYCWKNTTFDDTTRLQVRRNVHSSPKFHADELAAMKPPISSNGIFSQTRAKKKRDCNRM